MSDLALELAPCSGDCGPSGRGGRPCREHGCRVCGGIVLADTETWPAPLCPAHAPDDLIDHYHQLRREREAWLTDAALQWVVTNPMRPPLGWRLVLAFDPRRAHAFDDNALEFIAALRASGMREVTCQCGQLFWTRESSNTCPPCRDVTT